MRENNRDKKFSFWVCWLKAVSIAFAVFGVVIALLNQTPVFKMLVGNHIDPVFFKEATVLNVALLFQQWVYGLLGATCVLVGVLIFFIVKYAYSKKEKWAWNGILVGLIMWSIIDMPISFYFGVYFNVALNVVILVAALLPLVFTRKDFIKIV